MPFAIAKGFFLLILQLLQFQRKALLFLQILKKLKSKPMKKVFLLSIALLLLSFANADQIINSKSVNLIPNGDFEQAHNNGIPVGWKQYGEKQGTSSLVPAQGLPDGGTSLYITGTTPGRKNCLCTDTLNIISGTTYVLQFQAKADSPGLEMSALYEALDSGYYISEGPPVAYSNGIREIVEKVPLTNFLTETDGPVTYRRNPYNGQMTKPSFLKTVVEAVADVKKMAVGDVAYQIARNFEEFFNIKLS